MGQQRKKKIDGEYVEGGQRNIVQVLANGGFCALLGALYIYFVGWQDKVWCVLVKFVIVDMIRVWTLPRSPWRR